MKNYIFGDTGGHMKQYFAALHEIGVDTRNGIIPEGVRIIHLGDLIHKGPHSSTLLKRIDALIRNNPGQYIQILGNHEFQHIEGSPYFWRCNCTMEDIGIINDWYDEGLATPAYALPDIAENTNFEVSEKPKLPKPATNNIFFSHAGLSWHWWKNLGRAANATIMAEKINSLDVDLVTIPGQMLGVIGNKPGPVWAIGNSEVFNTWFTAEDPMPFIQMHGHTTSYSWASRKWWIPEKAYKPFRDVTKLNPNTHAVVTSVADSLLIGIDPGYSVNASGDKQPYVVVESLK